MGTLHRIELHNPILTLYSYDHNPPKSNPNPNPSPNQEEAALARAKYMAENPQARGLTL